jgi:triphosphoribosyl-dephospho-CoA synthase
MPASPADPSMTDGASGYLSTGQCASLACLLEVSAPKPGNVHRGADFEDLTFYDFVASSVAIAPAMQRAVERSVGETVLDAIRATRDLVRTNTNLGTVLLLAPLAAVPREVELADGIIAILDGLTPEDAAAVYQAIRLAQPGGLGQVDAADVHEAPPDRLRDAMCAAADRDLVARQYANGFEEVLNMVEPWFTQHQRQGHSLTDNIVHTYVRLLSQFPDSLIARKCGPQVARQASDYAAAVLKAGQPGDAGYLRALSDLDFWLRADHHRRNPGTTADLIATGLFATLRCGTIQLVW